jgi:hypothetical protein
MSYVNINDFDSNGFYLLGKAGYGGDSSDVSNQLQSGVTDIYSTMGAFAALKTDGSVVTWGGIEGIVSQNPWYIDLSYNIAYIDGKYIGIGKYNPPPYAPTNTTLLDISANVSIQGKLVANDISSSYIKSIASQWTTRPNGVITYADGNVGIGLTNPSRTLDVLGNTRFSGSVVVDDTTLCVDGLNNLVGIGTSSPSSALDISGQTRCSGDLAVGSSTLFVDTFLKRVGIGDSAPQYIFDVSGSGQFRNMNNAYGTSRISSISNITQSQLGDTEAVRLISTGTGIEFKAEPTVPLPSSFANTLLLYTFENHVFFNSITFTIDTFAQGFATSGNDISSSLILLDKTGTIIYNHTWTKTSPSYSVITIPTSTLDTFSYEKFPIQVQYRYSVRYVNNENRYLINLMNIDTTYTTNALFVQGNTSVVNGTLTVGKTTSTLVNPPTVDVSGTLSVSKDFAVNQTSLYVDTANRGVGIGRIANPAVVLDISSEKTGVVIRSNNNGLGTGQVTGIGIGKTSTGTNQFTLLYEHAGNDSAENRLLIGTSDISSLFFITANRNVGIGIQGRPAYSRLSLGNYASVRSVAVHEDLSGDRFYGFGATTGTLHLHARNTGALTSTIGQLILNTDGHVGIGTLSRPLTRRLVVGNPSASTGAYIEFNNHAITSGLDTSIFKSYAIGASLGNDNGASQQLQFVYTGTPTTQENAVLMALNHQGYLGLGISPTTNILDVSGTAPIRFTTQDRFTVRGRNGFPNVLTVDSMTSSIAINKNSASTTLDVNGSAHISNNISISGDLIVDDTVLFADSTNRRIGIHTDTPQFPLDIVGNTSITISDTCANILGDQYTGAIYARNTSSTGGTVMRLTNNNNQSVYLGIGGSANDRTLFTGAPLASTAMLHSNRGWLLGTSGQFDMRFYTNGAERMRVDSNGNVGINIPTPTAITRGKMVIEGFQNYPSGNEIIATSYGTNGITSTINLASGAIPVSLYSTHSVVCSSVVVLSDRRIKKDVIDMDMSESIDAIKKLKPVHFNYIDTTKRNSGHKQSGFIAQEVQKVIPSAVSYTHDTIPDIYGFVEIADGHLRVIDASSSLTAVDLSSGDILVLYARDNTQVSVRITNIISHNELYYEPVDSYPVNGLYFAYGRAVSDYHVVDNGTILATCVSAVQSLVTESHIRQKEVTALRNEVGELRKLVEDLLAKASAS